MFNGKPVYRQTFSLSITSAGNVADTGTLIATPNYVDAIVGVGGSFETGSSLEKYVVDAANFNINRYFIIYVDNSGVLSYRTSSNLARTNAPAEIWVDYTKV
jgi:hypothetical protein